MGVVKQIKKQAVVAEQAAARTADAFVADQTVAFRVTLFKCPVCVRLFIDIRTSRFNHLP